MRIKFFLALMLSFSLAQQAQAQGTFEVRGVVVDAVSGQPLPNVEVRFLTRVFFTRENGEINLQTSAPAGGKLLITLSKVGYMTKEIVVEGESRVFSNLGTVRLDAQDGAGQVNPEDLIPIISLSTNELAGEGEQNVASLLTSSNDIFLALAAFNFSAARFRLRGYEGQYTEVYLNGIPMNDLESGFPGWNSWGGLNDVVRNRQNVLGMSINPYAYGGVGGSTAFDTRASRQRKQMRYSYALSNRTYRNRVMATYSSGMLSSGWAYAISASRRWAEEGYIPGTPFDAYSYFLAVDRKLGEKHLVNLTAFGAPSKRGRAGVSTQEMNDFAGTNFYNPNWGYQNGEKRNSRIANTHEPVILLRHDWTPSERTRLTSAASYQFGRDGSTALDWYNARDPRPDYYRRLPSFIQDSQSELVAELLRSDENARQIDWAYMYDVNRNSVTTIFNANGIAGNNVTGRRAQYVVEDRRFDTRRANANINLEHRVNDVFKVSAGAHYQRQRVRNFKVLEDLLGADFYLDIDKFAEFDSTANNAFIQNDLDIPNRILKEGDVFGYDYLTYTYRTGVWAQAELSLKRFDLFAGANLSRNAFWREGNIRNGKFPENSAGKSDVSAFTDYGAKAGVTFKLDGRNYFILNGGYQLQAPLPRNAFISPRTRDQLVNSLSQEEIINVEGGYLLRAPYLKLRLMGYYTQFSNQINTQSFYLDNAIVTEEGFRGGFVNYVMTGINTRHMGLELGTEVAFATAWRFRAAGSLGQFIYNNRPDVSIFLDNVAQVVRQEKVYIKNFYLPNTPQTALTAGFSYNAPKFWFINFNVNYFDDIWIDFNPDRRTAAAVSFVENPLFSEQIVEPGSDLWKRILYQEKAPSAVTVDVFGGKSWKISRDMFLYLNVGVSNILDKQDFVIGGYEQFRFDYAEKNVDRFPNRYFYGFGRNYFINLALRM